MLAAIALVPSAPVIVPRLAGAAAEQTRPAREAMVVAAGRLPPRWVALGAAADAGRHGPRSRGTFAGYGVDVVVGLSPAADAPRSLPLPALVAGWLRGVAAPGAVVEVRVADARDGVEVALARGAALRTELDDEDEPVGVLVVADGHRTLGADAPGGDDADSHAAARALDDALAAGDLAALAALSDAVTGRVPYQELAGLVAPAVSATERLWSGAPFGVGYHVGVWTP